MISHSNLVMSAGRLQLGGIVVGQLAQDEGPLDREAAGGVVAGLVPPGVEGEAQTCCSMACFMRLIRFSTVRHESSASSFDTGRP